MGMDCIEGAARREGTTTVKSAVISSQFESISHFNGNKGEGAVDGETKSHSDIFGPLQPNYCR